MISLCKRGISDIYIYGSWVQVTLGVILNNITSLNNLL